MVIFTPKIDKARTEELTSFEIKLALRELTDLNGGVGVARIIIPDAGNCKVIVGENSTGGFEKIARDPEDALVAACDYLKHIIAEDASE